MLFRLGFVLALGLAVSAQPLRSLKTLAVPATPGLNAFVRDQDAVVALGKAFFWDMQAGSDGRTSCATCHFHAGADHRSQNQIADPNNAFPANLRLTMQVFHLRQLADPGNRAERIQQLIQDLFPGGVPEGLVR